MILTCSNCNINFSRIRLKKSQDGLIRCNKCIKLRADKQYKKAHKNTIKQLQKNWYENNKDLTKKRAVNWNKNNKMRRKEILIKYKNSPKGQAYIQKKLEKNRTDPKLKEYFNRKSIERYWKNVEYKRLKNLARKHNCEKTILVEVKERDKICQFCGTDKNLTFDHMHPVSRGGGTSLLNLQILCLSCNSFKNDKLFTAGKYPAMVVGL